MTMPDTPRVTVVRISTGAPFLADPFKHESGAAIWGEQGLIIGHWYRVMGLDDLALYDPDREHQAEAYRGEIRRHEQALTEAKVALLALYRDAP